MCNSWLLAEAFHRMVRSGCQRRRTFCCRNVRPQTFTPASFDMRYERQDRKQSSNEPIRLRGSRLGLSMCNRSAMGAALKYLAQYVNRVADQQQSDRFGGRTTCDVSPHAIEQAAEQDSYGQRSGVCPWLSATNSTEPVSADSLFRLGVNEFEAEVPSR